MYEFLTYSEPAFLAADIAAGDLSLTIDADRGWPTAGQFRILIDTELLLLQGGAGLTYTILARGIEGTTAAAHWRLAQCDILLTPQGGRNLTGGVRIVTGTTDTLQQTDRAGLVVYTSASPVAVTLPQAGAGDADFGAHWWCSVLALHAAATITPTTSTINDAATLALAAGQSARLSSDGTNYYAESGQADGLAGYPNGQLFLIWKFLKELNSM